MYGRNSFNESKTKSTIGGSLKGRFPANLIIDDSKVVKDLFSNSGKGNGGNPYNYSDREYNNKDTSIFNGDKPEAPSNFNDSGSASRFFYCAKSSKSERNFGCEELVDKIGGGMKGTENQTLLTGSGNKRNNKMKNNHPTVKALSLMRYLCKLITPKNGIILDPFLGSGSTAIAAKLEKFNWVGIEKEPEYCEIAKRRINAV